MNANQLKKYVVEPTLKEIDLYSEAAVNLILGTAAQESRCGHYIHQVNGPALGIYQMEPLTNDDIWNSYLAYHIDLMDDLLEAIGYDCGNYALTNIAFNSERLIWDLKYATIMCRLHYYRVPVPLPRAEDLSGLAAYWKKYYNTEKGKGTEQEFIKNYRSLIDDS